MQKETLWDSCVPECCDLAGDLDNLLVVLWGKHSKEGNSEWHTLTDDYFL